MKFRILIVFLVAVILVAYQQVRSQENSSSYNGLEFVDKAGNIRKPDGRSRSLPSARNLFSGRSQRRHRVTLHIRVAGHG
jgi:hypothetical protein